MQCIPEECIPLFGSKGEEWRENQFMKQLPAYDTCIDACHDMADLDKKRMTRFVDARRKKFFGVGEVEILPESKVTIKNEALRCMHVDWQWPGREYHTLYTAMHRLSRSCTIRISSHNGC